MSRTPTPAAVPGKPGSYRGDKRSKGWAELKQVNGALGEIRTHDLFLRREALYPLSYKRVPKFYPFGAVVPRGRVELPRP